MLDHSSIRSLAEQNEEKAPCLTLASSRSTSLLSDDNRTNWCTQKRATRSLISLHRPNEAQKWPEGSEKRPGSPSRPYTHTDKEKGKAGGEDEFRLVVTYRLSNIHDCYGGVD
jgi:hypothetical protein